MTSSLELLILALAEHGPVTAYSLRQAGISVGAAHPALARLVKRKALRRGPREDKRGKSAYTLTLAGRHEIAGWHQAFQAALARPPSDIESVFRLAAIAITKGRPADAMKLLERSAKEHEQSVSRRFEHAPLQAKDLGLVNHQLLGFIERARNDGNLNAVRVALSALRKAD